MSGQTASPGSLGRFAWLSIAAAVTTIVLKTLAWRLTGSVGLLSDALESLVNLVAAIVTLLMLGVAAKPPDDQHAFGHGKAEYFSSAAEGTLILLAAGGIGWTAVSRLLAPRPLEEIGMGVVVSVGASLVNLAVGWTLLKAGRRHHSIALEADAHHLMTDVWTSAGVLVAIGLVALTGWNVLDPIIALLVAAQIVWTGVQLLRRSAHGLLDTALAPAELEAIQEVLRRHQGPEVQFHAVRTRQAGARRFVSMHVLVPGEWSVRRGHDLLERIEAEVAQAVPRATVETHLEALEDPASWQDQELDRATPPPG